MEPKDYAVGDEFTLLAEHLKLLRAGFWSWQDCETGAPALDPKRPYGNSNVALDVAEVLGIELPDEPEQDQLDALLELHTQVQTALEVICFTGKIEPGRYRKIERELGSHTSSCWEAIEVISDGAADLTITRDWINDDPLRFANTVLKRVEVAPSNGRDHWLVRVDLTAD